MMPANDWSAHVHGLSDVTGALQMLGGPLLARVKAKAMTQGAAVLTKALKQRAPVLTGNLRAKVSVKTLNKVKNGQISTSLIGASIAGSVAKSKGQVNRPAYYIVMVNNGHHTKKRLSRAKADTRRAMGARGRPGSAAREAVYSEGSKFIPGTHFVEAAFDAAAPQVPAVFKAVLDDELAKLQVRK